MASMVTKECTDSSSQLPSSMPTQEKGSRNKRKFHADPPLCDQNRILSSFNDCPPYEFSTEKFDIIPCHGPSSGCNMCGIVPDHSDGLNLDIGSPITAGSCEAGPSRIRDEMDADEFNDADWSDFTESQLEELVLSNLDTIYKSAIKKIIACGYDDEVVMKAVLRSGLCYGCKDIISNIVDNTLAYIKNDQPIETSREQHCFEDLQQLEKYNLAELVCVLREVRPFFSTGDAMWRLLICDMNLPLACSMEGDPYSSNFGGDEVSNTKPSCPANLKLNVEVKSSEPNLPDPTKSNPPTRVYSSQFEIPSATGTSKQKKSLLEAHVIDKMISSSALDNAGKSFNVVGTSQQITQEEKFSGTRKFNYSTAKREYVLRQKPSHLEKNYRTYGSKGGRPGKLSGLGGLMFDKKSKTVSDASSITRKLISSSADITMKTASIKISRAVAVDAPQAKLNHNLSSNVELPSLAKFNIESLNTLPTVPKTNSIPSTSPSISSLSASPTSSLSTASTDLSLSLPTNPSNSSVPVSCSVKTDNCSGYAGIPYDKLLGHWFPPEQKDKSILMMVPRVCELQNELHEWTQWANEKVMQATRRLSKDNAELRILRQERDDVERASKEKQGLEESTMKKLSEMENALCKAGGQVSGANFAVRRLEVENLLLRRDMEAAKLEAAESAANCQEVLNRVKKMLSKIQLWEKQKILLQEELSMEKQHKLNLLQQELWQAKDLQNQLEARRKQEEIARQGLVTKGCSLRKEREQIEALAKSKESAMKSKADKGLKRYKDDIRKLEKEVCQLRLKVDSSKIAALKLGIDGSSYASRVTTPSCPGNRTSPFHQKAGPNISEPTKTSNPGPKDVKRERECVMCLWEEMCVVFLPCAHQVVCGKCNDLHEKQGMKDCPSCRSVIQKRVLVRYAPS